MNNKVFFNTGRDYGAPQVLEITYIRPTIAVSPFDAEPMTAHFADVVRGISGQVTILNTDATSERIGHAVLAEYDAGRYQ